MLSHSLEEPHSLGHPLSAAVELSGLAKQLVGDGELFDDALAVALDQEHQRRRLRDLPGAAHLGSPAHRHGHHLPFVAASNNG